MQQSIGIATTGILKNVKKKGKNIYLLWRNFFYYGNFSTNTDPTYTILYDITNPSPITSPNLLL